MSESPFSPQDWEQIKDLFAEALELAPEQRQSFVESKTANLPALREELLRLLANQPAGEVLIDRPLLGSTAVQSALKPQSLVPGEVLSQRFRIIRLLGRGGMGEVYEAEDLQLNTHIAIKTIRPETLGDDQVLARFRREIQLSRQVTHPNVCRVFDLLSITRQDGSPLDCLTMELLNGETLAAFSRREGKLDKSQALPLLRQMVDALAAAHKANVVHRDLKPSNIILVPLPSSPPTYRLVITDFGLSRSLGGDESHSSASGWGLGTPTYMSPEQVEGGLTERATDVYSLGIVLYEMLTGSVPFTGASPIEIAFKRLKEAPKPPREVNPQIDPRWNRAILRCLERHPKDRYARVEDLLSDVEETSSSGQRKWSNSSSLFRLKPSRRRNLAIFGVALFACIGAWQAYEYFAIPKFGSSATALYESGLLFLEQGSPLQARLALQQAVQQAPDYAIAHARLAEVQLDLDNLERAKDSILLASQGKAGPLDRERIRAIRSLVVRDHDAAVAVQKQIVKDSPAEARLISLLDLSRSQELTGDANGRRAALEEALKLDPANPYVLLQLGRMDAPLAKSDLAQERFHRAAEQFRQRGNSEGVGAVLLAQADQARLRSNFAAAEELLLQAERLAANINSPLLALRAEFSRLAMANSLDQDSSKTEQLRAALPRAEALGAQNLAIHGIIDLANLLSTQGKIEESRSMFLRAILAAESSKMLRALARARLAYGSFLNRQSDPAAEKLLMEAAAYFRANNLFLQALQAQRFLTNAWFHADRLEEAKAASEEMIQLAKARKLPADEASAAMMLANIAEYQGEFPEALRRYEAAERIFLALKLDSRVRSAREFAADTRRQLGDPAPARQRLLDVLSSLGDKNLSRQLSIELELVQFDIDKGNVAEARRGLARIKAAATKGKVEGLELGLHLATCKLEAEWGDAKRGVDCIIAAQDPKKFPSYKDNSIRSNILLAAAQVRAGQFQAAEQTVQDSIRRARPLKMVDNLFYALPILAEALKAQKKEADWQQTRQEWIDLANDLKRRWGADDSSRYFQRPIYSKHWQQLQPGL